MANECSIELNNIDQSSAVRIHESHKQISKELNMLISDSNPEALKKYIQENCQDYNKFGKQLKVVIKHGKEDMLEILLKESHSKITEEDIETAFKLAIEQERLKTIDILMSKHNRNDTMIENKNEAIIPFKIACRQNKYKIAKYIYKKINGRDRLEIENQFKTMLYKTEKSTKIEMEPFTTAAFLALTVKFEEFNDPLYNALLISKQLAWMTKHHKEYIEMLKLDEQCRLFITQYIAECKVNDVKLILSQNPPREEGITSSFPILQMAITYRQKELIGHINCQDALNEIWHDSKTDNWKTLNIVGKLIYILKQILHLLELILYYVFHPFDIVRTESRNPFKSQKNKQPSSEFHVPFHRFIYSFITYIIFISCICLDLLETTNDHNKFVTPFEIIVFVWIVGQTVQYIKQIFVIMKSKCQKKLTIVFDIHWFKFDCLMLLIFYSSFISWMVSYIIVTMNNTENLSREEWSDYDPLLIGEGLYAIASILAIIRVFYYLQVSRTLGPLWLSITRMLNRMISFLFAFFLLFFAFGNGLNALYKHYEGQRYINPEDGSILVQPDNFVTFGKTYKTLFWTLFGYGQPDDARIIVSNRPKMFAVQENSFSVSSYNGTNNNVMNLNKSYTMENVNWNQTQPDVNHYFTEIVGYTLFGLYHLASITILINMLIAIITNCFEEVQSNLDLEWKFTRTRIWESFFKSTNTIPPPFNLLPRLSTLVSLFKWCYDKCDCKKKEKISIVDQDEIFQKYQALKIKIIKKWKHRKYLVDKQIKCQCGRIISNLE